MEMGTIVAVAALGINLIVHMIAGVRFTARVIASTSSIQHSLDVLSGSVDRLRNAVDNLDHRIDEHDVRLAVMEAKRKERDN